MVQHSPIFTSIHNVVQYIFAILLYKYGVVLKYKMVVIGNLYLTSLAHTTLLQAEMRNFLKPNNVHVCIPQLSY